MSIFESSRADIAQTAQRFYDIYKSKGLNPLPPCDSKYKIEFRTDTDISYTRYGGGCVSKIEFGKAISERLIAHEVAHIFLPFNVYDWRSEALAEALASMATGNYHWPDKYFSERLYEKGVCGGEEWNEKWYRCSAIFVWYLSGRNWGEAQKILSDENLAKRIYVEFLKALANGIDFPSGRKTPRYETASYVGFPLSYSISFDGIAARYYKISLPGSGKLRIDISGNAESNIDRETNVSNEVNIAIVALGRGGVSFTITFQRATTIVAIPILVVTDLREVSIALKTNRKDLGERWITPELLDWRTSFAESINVFGNTVKINRPIIQKNIKDVKIYPEKIEIKIEIILSTCGGNIDTIYVLDGTVFKLRSGECKKESKETIRTVPYGERVKIDNVEIYAPKPKVDIAIHNWETSGDFDVVDATLKITTRSNYTYVILGHEIKNYGEIRSKFYGKNGVVEIDYGFEKRILRRPRGAI